MSLRRPSDRSWNRCPRTVLVVDTDPVCSASICRAIGTAYPVLAASCSEDAARTARIARPDLIIFDIAESGGTDAFAQLAELSSKDPAMWDTPLIVLSESNDAAELEFSNAALRRYIGHSLHAFLKRPASRKSLMAAVKRAIGPSVSRSRRGSMAAVNGGAFAW